MHLSPLSPPTVSPERRLQLDGCIHQRQRNDIDKGAMGSPHGRRSTNYLDDVCSISTPEGGCDSVPLGVCVCHDDWDNRGLAAKTGKNWDGRTLHALTLIQNHNLFVAVASFQTLQSQTLSLSFAVVVSNLSFSGLTRSVSCSLDPCDLTLGLRTRALADAAPPERLPVTKRKKCAMRHGLEGGNC